MPRKAKTAIDPDAGDEFSRSFAAHAQTIGGQDEPPPDAGAEPTTAQLLEQITNLNKELEGLKRAPAPVAIQRAQPVVPEAPRPVTVEGLPDPALDPEAFARGLNDRITQNVTGQLRHTSAVQRIQQEESRARDALFEEFAGQNPEIAEDTEGLTFVTQQVLQRAIARRWDVDSYMFQNSERFFRDVKDAYVQRFGDPAEDTADEGTADPEPVDTRIARTTGNNRTGGVFGGVEGGGRPAPTKKGAEQPGDMLKELQEVQRKMGLF